MALPSRISFAGDFALSWRQWDDVRAHRSQWASSPVAGLFAQSALAVANLECLPLPAGWPNLESRLIQVPAEALDLLQALNIGHVTLANNHILDSGAAGIAAVMSELDTRAIRHFGAGLSLEAAEQPLIAEIAGQKIALLGACDASYAWATPRGAGAAPLQIARLQARLREARAHADHVIFVLHCGAEFQLVPEHPRVQLCRSLADAGAAAIIQHHPHVMQPAEVHSGVPIAYSLGNFCFYVDGNRYMERRPHVRTGAIAHLDIEQPQQLQFEHVSIDAVGLPHLEPLPADLQAALADASKMLNDPKALLAAWRSTAKQESCRILVDAYWTMRRSGISAGYSSLRHALRQPRLRACLRTFMSGGLVS